MSVKRTDAQLQECYKIIGKIAKRASSTGAKDIPAILLQLKPLLQSDSPLGAKQLRKVKEYVWLNDLLHLNIETLREDFTKVEGRWETAAELASLLATLCAGLHPKRQSSQAGDSNTDQLREFYDILLPTSADSLLILANNLLEGEQQRVDSGQAVTELRRFQSILDSLLEVCRSHKQCIQRVLLSPYLLHLLITDLVHHCSVVLLFLRDLVVIDSGLFFALSKDVLHNMLDELAFKLSGDQELSAVLSLELLAVLSEMNHTMVEMIASRYAGILELAVKWSGRKRDDIKITNFISRLKAQVEVSTHDDVGHQAAAVIQAAWRGFTTRKKLKTMQRGIKRFQQMYRQRKVKKLKQAKESEAHVAQCKAKEIHLSSKRLTAREKQLSVIEQLPASEINSFVAGQKNVAVIAIQSWWRGRLARAKYDKLRNERRQTESAVVIQRVFRQYKKRWSGRKMLDHHLLPQIEGTERERLQGEIARYQEQLPPSLKTPADARALHDQVQSLTEQFYLSRVDQNRRDKERDELLSRLNENCEVLLRAPSLRDSYAMPAGPVDFTAAMHTAKSTAVSKMAQTAHREELRTLNTPWWKRQTTTDIEDVFALL